MAGLTRGHSGADAYSQLVGRTAEMRLLRQLVADVASGQGAVVTITGEHGIGKTRLAREAAAWAQTQGVPVVWGRGYDDEGAPIYWPWAELIDALIDRDTSGTLMSTIRPDLAELSLVSPRLRSLTTSAETGSEILTPVMSAQRYRVLAAVRRLMRGVANDCPHVIVLDDLQYFDPASLGVLEAVAQEVDAAPLLIVITYVDHGGSPALSHSFAELAKLPFYHRIAVGLLGLKEVDQLLRNSVGGPAASALAPVVHDRTEGNPLFVTEAIRVLESGAGTSEPGSDWKQKLPAAVGVLLASRLARLPGACLELLKTSALLGRQSSVEWISHVEGIGDDEALQVLEPAIEHGFVECPVPSQIRFSHELVRHAVADSLAPAERQRLHRRCAEALESLLEEGAEVGRLAHHFSLAGAAAKPQAIRYQQAAGVVALNAHAYQSALDYFQKAQAIGPEEPSDVADLKLLEARALVIVGRQRQAAALITEAFEILVAADDRDAALAALIYPYGWPGRDPNISLGPLREYALTLVAADSLKEGRLHALLAPSFKLESYEKGIAAAERAVAIARAHSDPALELTAIQSSAHVRYHHMDQLRHIDDMREARDLAHRIGDSAAETACGGLLVSWLLESGDRTGAERALEQVRAVSVDLGADYWSANYWGGRCYLALTRGAWLEVRSISQEAPVGDYSHMIQGVIAATTTDDIGSWLGDYIKHCVRIRENSCDTSAMLPHMMIVLAFLSHRSDCVEHLGQIRAWGREVMARPRTCPRDRLRLGLALGIEALMRGDREALGRVFELDVDYPGGYFESHITTDRYLGLFAAALDHTDQARGHYENALEFCAAAGFLPDLGWTCSEYAQLLIGTGETDRARTLVTRGLAIARELHMPRLQSGLGELEQLLVAPPPDGLTPRELEVLALVAVGKSNKEIGAELFVSYHTVVNHLRHMYSKTGVHTRVELANYAARHGIGSSP